jgi:hypothetical protein
MSATQTFGITVANVAPKLTLGALAPMVEGQAVSARGSFADPRSNDSWTATVDYGDGSGPKPLALNTDKTFLLNHAYSTYGSYTVTVTVNDGHGGVGTAQKLVNVANAAPAVTILDAPATFPKRGRVTVHGTASVPDPHDALTYRWTVYLLGRPGHGHRKGTPNRKVTTAVGPVIKFSARGRGKYLFVLTATDREGATGSDSRVITR